MITKEILKESGKNKGLVNKEHIEKDYFQDLFLFNLYKKTNLLIFKGGTALYKLYSLQRFSEDLDFSMLKKFDVKPVITETIKEIKNAKIKEIKETKNSILIKTGFKGIITRYNTLRIDISLNNPLVQDFEVKTYTSQYPDINPFSLRILSLSEILSEKIHALSVREKARDLYDLFFLLKIAKIDKSLIKLKLKNLGIELNFQKLKKRIKNLKPVWQKELKSFLLAELPEFNAVKDFVISKLEVLKD